jgi:hypothetical protein
MDTYSEMLKLAEKVQDAGIKDINAGGCCVYAALLGEALKQRGDKFRIVVDGGIWGGNISIPRARRNIKNTASVREWNANDVNFYHVFLEVKDDRGEWRGVDGEGEAHAMHRLPGFLPLPDAQLLAATEDGWNDWFNRKQIPKLRRIIHKHFDMKDDEE